MRWLRHALAGLCAWLALAAAAVPGAPGEVELTFTLDHETVFGEGSIANSYLSAPIYPDLVPPEAEGAAYVLSSTTVHVSGFTHTADSPAGQLAAGDLGYEIHLPPGCILLADVNYFEGSACPNYLLAAGLSDGQEVTFTGLDLEGDVQVQYTPTPEEPSVEVEGCTETPCALNPFMVHLPSEQPPVAGDLAAIYIRVGEFHSESNFEGMQVDELTFTLTMTFIPCAPFPPPSPPPPSPPPPPPPSPPPSPPPYQHGPFDLELRLRGSEAKVVLGTPASHSSITWQPDGELLVRSTTGPIVFEPASAGGEVHVRCDLAVDHTLQVRDSSGSEPAPECPSQATPVGSLRTVGSTLHTCSAGGWRRVVLAA
mmetsp:Transcript_25942/g.70145  ORF Transcript_25942/g.70145 Transcript_25942/m.70145 type:complete len:369 (+) Transcript_25942:62-1168(+)